MSFKVDLHKLDLVTKLMFYDSTWTPESGGFRNLGSNSFNPYYSLHNPGSYDPGLAGRLNIGMSYITTDGKIITNVNNLLSDKQKEEFIQYGEHRFIAIWSAWKYIKESPKEEEEGIKLCLAPYSIEKFIGSSKLLRELDENELHKLCLNKSKSTDESYPAYKNEFINSFLKYSRMVRLNVQYPPHNSLNIMSYYPLTHSQRRYCLDYIERYNVSPDRVFIDDHSKEQSIKRQLGLQFFR